VAALEATRLAGGSWLACVRIASEGIDRDRSRARDDRAPCADDEALHAMAYHATDAIHLCCQRIGRGWMEWSAVVDPERRDPQGAAVQHGTRVSGWLVRRRPSDRPATLAPHARFVTFPEPSRGRSPAQPAATDDSLAGYLRAPVQMRDGTGAKRYERIVEEIGARCSRDTSMAVAELIRRFLGKAA
jgi:hypothetical protein